MKWHERARLLGFFDQWAVSGKVAAEEPGGVFKAFVFALLRFGAPEERQDHKVAVGADVRCGCLRVIPQLAALVVGDVFSPSRIARRSSRFCHGCPGLGGFEPRRILRIPVEALDLTTTQPDERISVAKRVVDERERVLTGKRYEPQGELGEVQRDSVPIHAIQAPLRDHPPGQNDLVLVRRDWRYARRAPAMRPQGRPRADDTLRQERPGAQGRIADLQVRIAAGVGGRPGVASWASKGASVVRTMGSVNSRGV